MTDAQMITIVIAILASLGALMYNNSRISDLRTDVGKRIDDMKVSVNQHIDNKFNLMMERMQRMEDNITSQLADHETRLQRLERNK